MQETETGTQQTVDRRPWDVLADSAQSLMALLREKPECLKLGYTLTPGSILNAFRYGDIDFDKAVAELERWRANSCVGGKLMEVLCERCSGKISHPALMAYLIELEESGSGVGWLPGMIAGCLWPVYEGGQPTAERSILLTTTKPGAKGAAPEGHIWVCNVPLKHWDEAGSIERLKRAVLSIRSMEGWHILDQNGGSYPPPGRCKAAWQAAGQREQRVVVGADGPYVEEVESK